MANAIPAMATDDDVKIIKEKNKKEAAPKVEPLVQKDGDINVASKGEHKLQDGTIRTNH